MGFFSLLVMCSVMFVSTFLLGLVPMIFPLSQRHLRALTTFGIGLLIGACFMIIIPEGIDTIYAAETHSHNSAPSTTHPPIHLNNISTSIITKSDNDTDHPHNLRRSLLELPQSENTDTKQVVNSISSQTQHSMGLSQKIDKEPEHDDDHVHDRDHDHDHEESEKSTCHTAPSAASYIGLSLALGFIFMLVLDQISGSHSDSPLTSPHSHSHSHSHSHLHALPLPSTLPMSRNNSQSHPNNQTPIFTSHITVGINSTSLSEKDFKERERQRVEREKARERDYGYSSYLTSAHGESTVSAASKHHTKHAMIGILIHSAVDGLAMGAISVSSNSSLELVVFFAMLFHKLPAAFGLTSFLIFQRHTSRDIKINILIFALSAPVSAFATYFLLSSLTSTHLTSSSVGLCLLFSGGTFLFTIAMHIMPELQHQHEGGERGHEGAETASFQPLEWKYVFCVIIGILLPFASSFGHSHTHG